MTTTTISISSPMAVKARNRLKQERRKNRTRHLKVVALRVLVLILILIGWELASGSIIHELMISRPTEVIPLVWTWLTDGTIPSAVSTTFSSAFLGLSLGGIAGIIVGVVLAQSAWLSDVLEPFITALYTMPTLALIPLFIMWVGIGRELSVLTSAVIAFFLIFFNTFFGLRDVKSALINAVIIMGGTQLDVLWRVQLPSALVWVVAALKIAVPQAIIGVVIAEMMAGNAGMGYLVARNAFSFNSAGTYAALVTLLIVGFIVDRVMTYATKKPLEWKNSGGAM